MPYLETPDELAGAIADMVGVYGGCDQPWAADCPCKPQCRVRFATEMVDRIRQAAANEQQLERAWGGSEYDAS